MNARRRRQVALPLVLVTVAIVALAPGVSSASAAVAGGLDGDDAGNESTLDVDVGLEGDLVDGLTGSASDERDDDAPASGDDSEPSANESTEDGPSHEQANTTTSSEDRSSGVTVDVGPDQAGEDRTVQVAVSADGTAGASDPSGQASDADGNQSAGSSGESSSGSGRADGGDAGVAVNLTAEAGDAGADADLRTNASDSSVDASVSANTSDSGVDASVSANTSDSGVDANAGARVSDTAAEANVSANVSDTDAGDAGEDDSPPLVGEPGDGETTPAEGTPDRGDEGAEDAEDDGANAGDDESTSGDDGNDGDGSDDGSGDDGTGTSPPNGSDADESGEGNVVRPGGKAGAEEGAGAGSAGGADSGDRSGGEDPNRGSTAEDRDQDASDDSSDRDRESGGSLPAVGTALLVGSLSATRQGAATAATGQTAVGLRALLWSLLEWGKATLPSLVGLAYSRRADDDPLDHDVRAEVYETVERAPGTSLSDLAECADVSMSSVRHHLRVLEEASLVESELIRGRRRFFPADAADPHLVAALDDHATRTVLEAVGDAQPASVSEVAERTGRDPSTVSHHLTGLADAGLVERERDGRAVRTRLAPEVTRVLEVAEGETAATAD